MKVELSKLSEAAKAINLAIDTKTKTLINDTLELIADGKQLSLCVTNREYYVTSKVQLDEDVTLHASVNSKLFLSLISKLTCDTVELEVDGQVLKIKGNGDYKLPLIFLNDSMLELPKIEVDNVTNNFDVSNDILQSILKFNSKELQRGNVVKDCQEFYYIDETGCITFTSGACVNNFTLPQQIKMMLTEKLVRLFKLFSEDTVNLKLGHTQITPELVQDRIQLETNNVTITSILDGMKFINDVPCTSIRGLSTKVFPFSLEINKELLLQSLTRLTLFNTDSKYGRFAFANGELTVKDWSSENTEKVPYVTNSTSLSNYEAYVNMNSLSTIVEGCEDASVKVSFGDHTAFVVNKGSIVDILPELKKA